MTRRKNLDRYLDERTILYWDVPLNGLPDDERDLLLRAREATKVSHSPYSRFRVGAAVLLSDGQIVTGANQENASYGLTVCAERTTIFATWNLGRKDIVKLAVTGRTAAASEGKEFSVDEYRSDADPASPCGACRQVIKEAEDRHGEPMIILVDAYNDERIRRLVGIESIMPWGFSGKDFGMDLNG
ncbi:cytidine deaminase [Candidatus Peregrinibacteria bacterium CG10_big_fil_rev_8_21_14_0_10_49_16]|nr:MAG: cytidine deaminase [Candidatus Peregrinibacteria bacterium CG10_big_fil_rev_8_21_14_0_10_49_16]